MNIGSPISSVVPTLDGSVLEVLAGSSVPLTLSEVDRRASRGTPSGVRKVLRRLVNEGLVLNVPGGYLLNREHVAAGAVEALVTLRAEFLLRLRDEVASWTYHADLVGLFGSFARREGDSESDIDILVIGEEHCPDEVLDNLGARILNWTGNRAQVMALTRTDLRRLRSLGELILAEWHRDLEIVQGDAAILDVETA